MVGRPLKYGEKTRLEHYALPISVVYYLDTLCKEKDFSKTELIINALITSDKELLKKFTSDINALRENYKDMVKTNQELSNKLNNSTISFLYEQIKEDKNLTEFLEYFKVNNKSWLDAGTIKESELLEQFEKWLFKNKNLMLKNTTQIKLILKTFILGYETNKYKKGLIR